MPSVLVSSAWAALVTTSWRLIDGAVSMPATVWRGSALLDNGAVPLSRGRTRGQLPWRSVGIVEAAACCSPPALPVSSGLVRWVTLRRMSHGACRWCVFVPSRHTPPVHYGFTRTRQWSHHPGQGTTFVKTPGDGTLRNVLCVIQCVHGSGRRGSRGGGFAPDFSTVGTSVLPQGSAGDGEVTP